MTRDALKAWVKRNGPLTVVMFFAVLALLYLGDDVVRQRQQRLNPYPILPEVESDDPRQGTEDPQVTIFAFEDFSCIVCKEQVSIIKELINNFGNVVAVIWKDAPLDPLRPQGKTASIAAHCAGRQNKFWEMHDLLFQDQEALNRDTYVAYANTLKLNADQFTKCIDKQETLSKVDENIKAAEDAKLEAVPTFFIEGERYEGYLTYDEFLDALPR